jgi:hypothetical protein
MNYEGIAHFGFSLHKSVEPCTAFALRCVLSKHAISAQTGKDCVGEKTPRYLHGSVGFFFTVASAYYLLITDGLPRF